MYKLYDSTRSDKKFMVITPLGQKIHFWEKWYEDYTQHLDKARKERYIARNQKNEDWTSSGLNTAGFWDRYLLWNKSTILQSIVDIDERFNIEIEYDSHHNNV